MKTEAIGLYEMTLNIFILVLIGICILILFGKLFSTKYFSLEEKFYCNCIGKHLSCNASKVFSFSLNNLRIISQKSPLLHA